MLALISLSQSMFGQAPSVQTNYANRVFGTSAILSGYVDPNNDSTESFFIYWKNSSSNIDTSSIYYNYLDAGTISQTVTGLSPNSYYNFRIIAKNKKGTSVGLVNSFYTPMMTSPYVYIYDGWGNSDTDYFQVGGYFQANGIITTTWFQYDSLPNLFRDSTSAVLQQETDWNVWEQIYNLKTYKKYYVRLVAKNDSGITYSNVIIIRTQGSKPPIVVTDTASNVTQSIGTLNGTINSLGNCYSWHFEYGISPTSLNNVIPINYLNYGSICRPYNSNNPDVDLVSSVIYNLPNNTTQYYRLVGQSIRGTTRGNVMSFTTQGSLAPDAITLSADSVSYTSAQPLGWYDAKGTPPVQNSFEYGETVYLGLSTPPVSDSKHTDSVRVKIPNLKSGTQYFFRQKSKNQYGITYGNVITFTTLYNLPPNVTTDSVVNIGLSTASVYGTFDANKTATSSWVEFDTLPNTFSQSTSKSSRGNGSGMISESLYGLLPNHIYNIRCVDSNIFGTTYGRTITIRTLNNEKPSAVTDSANGIADTYARLNGYADGKGTNSSFQFEYGLSPNSMTNTTTITSFGMGYAFESFVIYGLQSNTKYYFRIKTNNNWGSTNGNILSFTTTPNEKSTVNIIDIDSITPLSAKVTVVIDGKGTISRTALKYGTTLFMNSQTGFVNATKVVDTITFKITSLTPDQLYYISPIGDNNFGTSNGSVLGFYTPNNQPPSVATDSVNNIGLNSLSVYGNFDSKKNSTQTWIEYDTLPNLFSQSTSKISRGSTYGNISQTISSLLINHSYYIRYVAENVYGKVYGQSISVQTLNNEKPAVSTDSADAISTTYANLNAHIDSKGTSGNFIFEFGTSPNSLTSSTTSTSFGIGNVQVSGTIYGLSSNTKYYYRIKASNVWGVSSGNILSFTTASNEKPMVEIISIDSVSSTSSTIKIAIDGKGTLSKGAIKYGTTLAFGNQTGFVYATKIVDTILVRLNALSSNQQYYVAPVGENVFGTTQGNAVEFTTLNNQPPSVATDSVNNIGLNSLSVYGNFDSKKNSTSTWVLYDTLPTLFRFSTTKVSRGVYSGNISETITSLLKYHTYYIKYAAENSYGVVYGQTITVKTLNNEKPSAVTDSADGITDTYANLNALVDGKGVESSYQFEYGLAPNSLINTTTLISFGKGVSNVSTIIYGQQSNTTIYYRVKAINNFGFTRGNIFSFTTAPSGTPIVSILSIENINTTTAKVKIVVNGQGSLSKVALKFGTTLLFGAQTGFINTSKVLDTITTTVTGLIPDNHYYIAPISENSFGQTQGVAWDFNTINVSPTVTTNTASSIGLNYAVLDLIVNGNGSNTTTHFIYGKSVNSLSNKTFFVSSGKYINTISIPVYGLDLNTVYYYQSVASSNWGSDSGVVKSFRTLDNPTGPPPSTSKATIDALSTTSGSTYGTVNATFNGHGNGFSYWIEYNDQFTWASTPIMTSKDTGVQTIPILLPNLLMNRVWYCTVHLKNSLTDTVAFVELSTFNIMPPTVKTLPTLGVFEDKVIVAGFYDGFDAGVNYWFEYGDSFPLNNKTNITYKNATHDSLSKLINNLKSGRIYFYRFSAQNKYGTSYGDVFQFKTLGIALGINKSEAGKILVYPNPTNDIVNITGYSGVVVLSDMSGKKLIVSNLKESGNTLDLSSLPTGMYILELEDSTKIKVIKK